MQKQPNPNVIAIYSRKSRFTGKGESVLDMFGDLALIGYRLQGKIKASKSGHHVNNVFARTLLEATNSYVIEEETESKVIKEQAASCQPYGSFSENIAASAV